MSERSQKVRKLLDRAGLILIGVSVAIQLMYIAVIIDSDSFRSLPHDAVLIKPPDGQEQHPPTASVEAVSVNVVYITDTRDWLFYWSSIASQFGLVALLFARKASSTASTQPDRK